MTFKNGSIISDITWYDDYIRVLSRYTWSYLKTNSRESEETSTSGKVLKTDVHC